MVKLYFLTRSGNQIELPNVEKEILENYSKFENKVIHGEILIKGYIDPTNRSLTNGKITSLIAKESTLETFERKMNEAKTPQALNKLEKELAEKIYRMGVSSK